MPLFRRSRDPRPIASTSALPAPSTEADAAAPSYVRPPEFDVPTVNEEHIRVFERALRSEETDEPGVEHIRSVSDFAPIREKVRRSSRKRRDVVREGWAYHVSRWPLLIIIFTLIGLEFMGYIIVRQCVNVIELFSGWRGQKGRLRMALRQARTYGEWRAIANELDELLGYTAWKRTPSNAYYDSGLVQRVIDNLREMREKGDAEGVCAILEVCLRSNFAGIESPRLYSECYMGTKSRIEAYVEEVERAIEYIRFTPDLSVDEKAKLFKYVTKNNGSTALCLSGGASFGYYHFGVVKAMLDANLLPKVITGTSAGALVAAFVCTHTDGELRRMIIPELSEKINACEEPFRVWIRRWWRTGARFDTLEWARKASFWTNGSTTFREAYERTGRVLNVSVIPYDTHSPTKLLNVHTAPDCLIFTAIIASAAVPGILNPVVLMTKDRKGNVKPWQFQGRHKDGSLRVDIPLQSLHLFFNVTYSIISQVNPHIHLFAFQPRGAPGRPVNHRKGRGWRGGFFLSAMEQFLKLDLTKNFKVIRDLELMPELLGQNWSGVFLQKFEGSVTIWPKSRAKDWTRLLSDPDDAELARMIRVGESVTWPKLHMIDNRMRIERQVEMGRAACRAHYAQAAKSGQSHLQAHHYDSSTSLDDSDDDMVENLGGPEADAPVPRRDEGLREGRAAVQERRDQANLEEQNGHLQEDETMTDDGQNDEVEGELLRGRRDEEDMRETIRDLKDRNRRAGSAPVFSNSPGSARKRRQEIVSRLGLLATPSRGRTMDDIDERIATASAPLRPSSTDRQYNASRENGAEDGLSTTRRRRLSTGQILFGRANRGRAVSTGSSAGGKNVFGVSDEETDWDADGASDRSFK